MFSDESTTLIAEGVRRLLRRATSRAAIPYMVIALFIAFGVVFLGRELVQNIDAIERWITALGPWGVVAFVALFVCTTSCLMPDSILCIAAGALFGLWWGVFAVLLGILLSAAVQFGLARRLLHDRIQVEVSARPALAAIQRAVVRDEFRLQILVRLTPINPAIVNYILGATHVRFVGFLTACLALMPVIMVEVYFGHASRNMVRLADGLPRNALVEHLTLLAGLGACVIVLLVASRMARRALLEAVAEIEEGDATDLPE